ncbi:Cation transporter [Cynara cardunculus var. scolymus]|uniref:Cation transporter n=2 Tax=Cynara cardunculus var. scolymus TaxID=59895 RepID=A0A103Y8A5_CYNCS|nr:Cation transporter [Cynara cardunculus var. scolymus]
MKIAIAPTSFQRKAFVSSFLRVDLLWLQLSYFATLSVLGFIVLANLEPRNPLDRPKNFDLLFTSVSATTVSSMATVDMEVFSNTQLFILSILMLLGGEVFTSMLELQIQKFRLLEIKKTRYFDSNGCTDLENNSNSLKNNGIDLKHDSMKFLGSIVLIYFLTVHISSFLLVSLYISLVPSAKEVLSSKDLNITVFSTVTIISTFTNCGYLPTNENMMVFKKDLGLQLILIPLGLLGNTLYPVFLRILLSILRKVSDKEELEYVLRNHWELGYSHLLSGFRCRFLGLTCIGFIGIQFVVFVSMGWKSELMEGLNPLEKVIGSLFQVVNTRHTGESVFDLSLVTPAILVLFIMLM